MDRRTEYFAIFWYGVMRELPWQTNVIVGGGFGGVRGAVPDMAGKIRAWSNVGSYGADEEFLASVVYPLVRDRALRHDSFAASDGGTVRPFPALYQDYRFVGERMGADRCCVQQDREALVAALASTGE